MKAFNGYLQGAVDRILAEWAMMMVDPVNPGETRFIETDQFWVVSAHFSGVIHGTLRVVCQAPFLDVVTQNVLGIDSPEEITPGDRIDAARELANVISGNFLTDAFGTDTVFDLPSYVTRQQSWAEAKAFLGTQSYQCLGDGQPLAVAFEIDAEG